MFAQLGDHIFKGLKTPTSLSDSEAVKYAQIPRVNDKPTIQPTGSELVEMRLSIQYSVDFCDPTTEIDALKKSMRTIEVLPYITGDGRVLGKFVITNIETTYQRCAADGRVELATININLLEVSNDAQGVVVGSTSKQTGQALASQKPTTELPTAPTPSPASDITTDIAAAKSKVNGIKKTVSKVKNKTTDFKRGVREVRQLATDAKTSYTTAQTKVENTKKIIERASELPTSLEEAIKYAENLAKLDNVTDISILKTNADQLSKSADKVTTHTAPIVGFAGTKEGGN